MSTLKVQGLAAIARDGPAGARSTTASLHQYMTGPGEYQIGGDRIRRTSRRWIADRPDGSRLGCRPTLTECAELAWKDAGQRGQLRPGQARL